MDPNQNQEPQQPTNPQPVPAQTAAAPQQTPTPQQTPAPITVAAPSVPVMQAPNISGKRNVMPGKKIVGLIIALLIIASAAFALKTYVFKKDYIGSLKTETLNGVKFSRPSSWDVSSSDDELSEFNGKSIIYVPKGATQDNALSIMKIVVGEIVSEAEKASLTDEDKKMIFEQMKKESSSISSELKSSLNTGSCKDAEFSDLTESSTGDNPVSYTFSGSCFDKENKKRLIYGSLAGTNDLKVSVIFFGIYEDVKTSSNEKTIQSIIDSVQDAQ